MKRNLALALICALSFTAVSCGKNSSKQSEAPIAEGEQKVLPEGVFEDGPVLMNSDYMGENLVLIKSEKDVKASEGQIVLKGDDAKALFAQLNVQKVSVPATATHDSGWSKTTQGWSCVEQAQVNKIHPETDGYLVDTTCALNINYSTGKVLANQRTWPAQVGSLWGSAEVPGVTALEKNYRGEVLTMVAGESAGQKAWVKLSGADARILFAMMSVPETASKSFEESTGIVEKTSGDITCNKTPVTEGVAFDCYVYFSSASGSVIGSLL